MKLENKIILNEMYHELLDEKKALSNSIDKNISSINEIYQFIKSLYDEEDTDYIIFSPRQINSSTNDEITKEKIKIQSIENDNHNHYEKLNKIQLFIERIEKIINESDELFNLTILDIQEQDRQRIARDLHDVSLQQIAHIVHMNELASLYIDEDILKTKLQLASINKNLKEVIDEIRKIIFDLRPMSFDDLGFKDTLENLFSRITLYSKINVTYSVEDIKCTQEILIALYRVINECCINSIKHSECTKLDVKVYSTQNIINIEIEDNGVGFDISSTLYKQNNHFGLKIMKERIDLLKGNIKFISNIETGTKIIISILYKKKGE